MPDGIEGQRKIRAYLMVPKKHLNFNVCRKTTGRLNQTANSLFTDNFMHSEGFMFQELISRFLAYSLLPVTGMKQLFLRPWQTGKFQITAGLKPLEDRPVFLHEPNHDHYIENKKKARKEDLLKFYPLPVDLSNEEMQTTASVLRSLLAKDRPELTLYESTEYRDEIDLIISQVPEDFAVWKYDGEKEWLALIHLMSPNHWDARKKIGKDFLNTHLPVPHIDPLVKASLKMFEQVQKRGAQERYAWGVATDTRLNHHPEPPYGVTLEEWQGRSFNVKSPELYVRIERQTLFPITDKTNGFTIKTSFVNVSTLPSDDLRLIASCLESMDDKILSYKGLLHDKEPILSWIDQLITANAST